MDRQDLAEFVLLALADQMEAIRLKPRPAAGRRWHVFQGLFRRAIKSAARRRLGNLCDPLDYPLSLRGLFDLAWDYPNV